ncbi:hypothetical protein QYM36_001763 [Artemia franciscana]|uniref:Uncharacterized protein n=1 Tax=Artemia franciscana TaxID=6661 RepID=A0AA88IM40_ARTSF|nr:hypothetical protein QYM36_001763 [Artemia franciscana]
MEISLDTEISNLVKEIQSQLSSKCSRPTQDVCNIVHETISSTNPNFATEVRKVIRSEQDREKRRLNIIAYGIVPADDETGTITHIIHSSYDFDPGPITNVRRLNASTSRSSTTSRPSPLIFSVSSWDIRKKILQISRQRNESVQFRNYFSRDDKELRKRLVEEVKRRIEAGDTGLVIRDLSTVSKNDVLGARRPSEASQDMEQ